MRNNNFGFAMMDVLVGTALCGVVAIGISGSLPSFIKVSGGLEAKREANTLTEELKFALGTHAACLKNLNGLPVGTVAAGTTLPVTSPIGIYNGQGVPSLDGNGNPRYILNAPSSTFSWFHPTSVQIDPGRPLSGTPNQFLGSIIVTDSQGLNGSIQRQMPLIMTQNASGAITDCIAGLDMASDVLARICEVSGKGITVWNAATQTCDSIGTTWYPGVNSSFAACPPGLKLGGSGQYKCGAKPPPGFVDPLPPIVRVFGNGQKATHPNPPFVCNEDLATNSCTCYPAVGIDPTGFIAQAACL